LIPNGRIDERGAGARGTAIGAAWRARIGVAWEGYERLFAAVGAGEGLQRDVAERSLDQTRSWAPALAGEIDGIAAGAGLESWRVAALNARTEILAAAGAATVGECSTFVLAPPSGGPPRTIQTWDWYEKLRENMLLLAVATEEGRAVHLFTEFGIVGKIGVNDAGLGLHFNILHHRDDGRPAGVPVHVVARRILDEATTIAEATAIAGSATVSASTVLTVVGWDGERASARCLELSPAGVGVLEPDVGGMLLHTNHFLDAGLAAGEAEADAGSTTRARLAALTERAGDLTVATDPTTHARALIDHDAGICCHSGDAMDGEPAATLATISLDVAGSRVHAHAGGPCAVAESGWTTA
jgi:isopenicillin-N N-acyltransferase-like protein